MKKSTCKIFIALGSFINFFLMILVSLIVLVSYLDEIGSTNLTIILGIIATLLLAEIIILLIGLIKGKLYLLWLGSIFFLLYGLSIIGLMGAIFILIGLLKWDSEQEKAEILKSRAKVHIHVKGKMKDIEND